MMPRIGFAGTPQFAAVILNACITAGWEIPVVISQPAAKAGRGQAVRDSAVSKAAQAAGLPLETPERISDRTERIRDLKLDALVVAAYGQLIPAAVFDAPAHGTVNVHASLLPKYRGASPISAAIRNGDAETGISLMRIEAGLDAGPVYGRCTVGIGSDDTAGTLTQRLSAAGAEFLIEQLPRIIQGELNPIPQDDSVATQAPQMNKADGRIDWNRSAPEVGRHIRAMQPWPGAWTMLGETRVEVISGAGITDAVNLEAGEIGADGAVGTGSGDYRLDVIKPAGKPEMRAADWLRNQPAGSEFA